MCKTSRKRPLELAKLVGNQPSQSTNFRSNQTTGYPNFLVKGFVKHFISKMISLLGHGSDKKLFLLDRMSVYYLPTVYLDPFNFSLGDEYLFKCLLFP